MTNKYTMLATQNNTRKIKLEEQLEIIKIRTE